MTEYHLPKGTRRTLVAGLTAQQAAVAAGGLTTGAALMNFTPAPVGPVTAAVAFAGSLALSVGRWHGRPLLDQAAPAANHLLRKATRQTNYQAPYTTTAELPAPTPGAEILDLPGQLHGLTLRAVDLTAATRTLTTLDAGPLCVLDQPGDQTVTVLAEISAPSFLLADDTTQDNLVRAWGTVLDQAARQSSPIATLQIVDMTVPGTREGATAWHTQHTTSPTASTDDYAALRASIAAGTVHRTMIAVTVDKRRAKQARRTLGGSTIDVLLAEAVQLVGNLAQAHVTVTGWLSPTNVARLLRDAYDPASANSTPSAGAVHTGPMMQRTMWGTLAHDSAISCTLWAAAWPTDPLDPTMLRHVILPAGVDRRISLTFRPVDPATARRQVKARRTTGAALAGHKTAHGQLVTAEDHLHDRAAERTEHDLAHGAGLARWAMYITVTADSPETLETGVAEILSHAAVARIDLRRLYGAQDAGFTFTLPLGRGIKAGRS